MVKGLMYNHGKCMCWMGFILHLLELCSIIRPSLVSCGTSGHPDSLKYLPTKLYNFSWDAMQYESHQQDFSTGASSSHVLLCPSLRWPNVKILKFAPILLRRRVKSFFFFSWAQFFLNKSTKIGRRLLSSTEYFTQTNKNKPNWVRR